MTIVIRTRNHYGVDNFFYFKQGDPEMLGVGEGFMTYGFHDPRTAQIMGLNDDFAKDFEQDSTLAHELGHGNYRQDPEDERRRKDSVGDYGFVSIEYCLN